MTDGDTSLRVTWVCTANVCRSVYGQVRLQQEFARHGLGGLQVESLGINAHQGQEPDPRVVERLGQLRADTGSLRGSRLLVPSVLEESDLIITMSGRHAQAVAAVSPASSQRTVLALNLLEVLDAGVVQARPGHAPRRIKRRFASLAAQAASGSGLGVADPYGRSSAEYEVMFAAVDRLTTSLAAWEASLRSLGE